jgi:hypothetical protein
LGTQESYALLLDKTDNVAYKFVDPKKREFTLHSYNDAIDFTDSVLLKVHDLTPSANNDIRN